MKILVSIILEKSILKFKIIPKEIYNAILIPLLSVRLFSRFPKCNFFEERNSSSWRIYNPFLILVRFLFFQNFPRSQKFSRTKCKKSKYHIIQTYTRSQLHTTTGCDKCYERAKLISSSVIGAITRITPRPVTRKTKGENTLITVSNKTIRRRSKSSQVLVLFDSRWTREDLPSKFRNYYSICRP